jgi:hypothetical protein
MKLWAAEPKLNLRRQVEYIIIQQSHYRNAQDLLGQLRLATREGLSIAIKTQAQSAQPQQAILCTIGG